ncbi:hypothetical protein B0T10DRAFT_468184, partial [Thelonectria olida]
VTASATFGVPNSGCGKGKGKGTTDFARDALPAAGLVSPLLRRLFCISFLSPDTPLPAGAPPHAGSMNSTSNALAGDAGDEASADNQFTHANLFGIYLTLVFCVLTQPVGSLLMDMPFGAQRSLLTRLGLLPLRLWRLNPIACGAEGWLILVILGKRAVELWNSKSLVRGNAPLGLHLERLLDRMHVVATSLLIIRAHQVDESGKQIVQQLDYLAFAGRSEEEDEDDNETALPLNRSHDPSPESGERRAPVSRPSRLPGIDQVLHPGVLTRSDGWVDAVTVLSIVTITAKLAAVTLPFQLRVALSFMILGWLGVALLSLDKRAVARETQRLSKPFPWLEESFSVLNNRPWLRESPWHDVALGAFVVPILVYLCYAMAFAFPLWEDWEFTPAGILNFGWCMISFLLVLIITFPPLLFILLTWGFDKVLDSFFTNKPAACTCLYFLSFYPLYLGYIFLGLHLIINYPVECDIGMRAAVFVSTVVLKVGFLAALYKEGSLFYFFWFLNPVIVGLGVPAAFELYSPEGSFKPDWLDWLG